VRLARLLRFLWIAVPLCAAPSDTTDQAAARFDLALAKLSAPLRLEFRALAAKALQPRHPALAQKFTDPPAPKPSVRPGPRPDPAATPTGAAITKKLDEFTRLPAADRNKFAADLASQIRTIPPGIDKFLLAWNLRVEAVGEPALEPDTVVAVLSLYTEVIQNDPSTSGYLDLAELARYAHLTLPVKDPAVDAAEAFLELRERLHEEADFSLAALDGKTYSLSDLRGKVVLLNFWGTSCVPCRQEMPDMEKLHREFQSKGLVILAVSDDERKDLDKFLATKTYTFPILLDHERKTFDEFDVDDVPKTFVFDREGHLVAQAIDKCSATQFRSMLKAAGLE
jgi:peroxiredoxin